METRTSFFHNLRPAIAGFFPRLRAGAARLFRSAWNAIKPAPGAAKPAGRWALAAGFLAFLAFLVTLMIGSPLTFALPAVIPILLMGALLVFLGQGIVKVLELFSRIPWSFRWAAVGAFLLAALGLMGFPNNAGVIAAGLIVLAAALTGMGLHTLRRPAALSQKVSAAVYTVLGLAVFAALAVWYFWQGAPPEEIANAAASGGPVEKISLPNPGERGPYTIATLTYGSGTDRYRPEYAEGAAIQTGTVDGSRFLDGAWKGIPGDLRELAWGVTPDALPLNGRVWYPEGDGPFPLVLIVHGNHNMTDFSDPGYDYLGELLASRGFIFVSVDENFINGGAVDLFDGFSGENDARGWLLLEHLRVWHAWNRDAANPFFGKVDVEKIAVAGHSRGGEAAAVAAAFNRLPRWTENYVQTLDYQYGIRAVVAIAPIDGQYTPGGRGTMLRDVDYFVLHGSHDSDVTMFDGLNQLERVTFDPTSNHFKSALYLYRANHGQFNTTWGDSDVGLLNRGLLKRAELLPAADQRRVAEVYISAFLEASLNGKEEYRALLQDARAAPDGWLPDVITIHRYEQAGDQPLVTFDEDVDLETTTIPGGSISATGFLNWNENRIQSKWGGMETSGVALNWNENATPRYTITLPDDYAPQLLNAEPALIFQLADGNNDPAPANDQPAPEGPRQPVDLTVTVIDADGSEASLALSSKQPVQPQLVANLYKLDFLHTGDSSEPILASYAFPFADFQSANPEFNPATLRQIRFTFDQTERGSVVLDGVGIRP